MTIDGGILNILIYILIIFAIGWAAFWFLGRMAIPSPFDWIVRLVVGVILLIALLNLLGVFGGVKVTALGLPIYAALSSLGFA